MLEVLSTYFVSLFPEVFNPVDILLGSVYLVAAVFLLAGLIRLIHKKASPYNHALSSAMALMFMYILLFQLHRFMPAVLDPLLDKLPLIEMNSEAGTVSLFQFSGKAFLKSCTEFLYVFILSFCLIGLDDIIPDAKNTGSWILLQFIIVCIAMGLYSFILRCMNLFIPEVLDSVAPMILVCILLFMVFLGLLKVILTLVLVAVNPLLGAVSAFFSGNKLGMALGKSVMCSLFLTVMVVLLSAVGLSVISLADLTFLVCCTPMAVLLILWVVIGHVL